MSTDISIKQVREYLAPRVRIMDARESMNIVRMLAEWIVSLNSSEWQHLAQNASERVNAGEPVQYIIGSVWFFGIEFTINNHVLIPRPETEELIAWILEDYRKDFIQIEPAILDIGTGSGCIPVVLGKKIPNANLTALDISHEALSVARTNAERYDISVDWLQLDVLHDDLPLDYGIIVSNPPYVSFEEFASLSPGVRDYEPTIALRPPVDNPDIFYARIADIGLRHLRHGGRIYVELNEFRADEINVCFTSRGYGTALRKDMQGKWRKLSAWIPNP